MIGRVFSFLKRYFDKKDRQKEIIADFHTTIIRVDDNFISSSSVMLDERLMGNIFSLKEVIVAQTAEISGNITSRVCTVNGKVSGDILSTEYAEIKSSAIITGNIRAKSISIEPGSVINGSIRIEGEIDDHDLIEKVKNRLPAKNQLEIEEIPFLLSDQNEPEKELIFKTETQADRPSEITLRDPLPGLKNKAHKTPDLEESNKSSASSWY